MTQPLKQVSKLADRSGNPQIANRGLAITAVGAITITDADGNLGATTQAELQGYFNALSTAVDAVIERLEAHGLIANN